jgi:excisionase family DNA binding protein
MKKNNVIFVTDQDELVDQLKTALQEIVHSELQVLRKPEKQNSEVYFTKAEVAEMLSLSHSTIHRMVANGTLRCYKLHRKLIFKSSDVEAALIQINVGKGSSYAY